MSKRDQFTFSDALKRQGLVFQGAWPKVAPCACGCGESFLKGSPSAKLPGHKKQQKSGGARAAIARKEAK